MVSILAVEEGSPAWNAGIRAGDVLLRIDEHPIADVLDYRFFLTEKSILLALSRDGKAFEVRINKPRYDDIGLEFETFLMDKKKRCANRCIFCFIDQNPCGMRETIYFKDDDTRLSFLMGNYVTLTNVSKKDLERIVAMRLSPVNVSVHTTNPALRVKMLGNPRADRIKEQLRLLADGGIDINCQIVLCRGINDGAELERTLTELAEFFPAVQSIAVVPAGLTRHREKLPRLIPYDRDSARAVLDTVDHFAARFQKTCGLNMVYAADEFYLAASRDLPPEEAYDGYPQLDNGVGLLRSTEEEMLKEIAFRSREGHWDAILQKKARITLLTGVAAAGFLNRICGRIRDHLPHLEFCVKAVENRFFGESVTVAGLLCGADLVEAAKGVEADALIFPAVALRHGRDRFLDDVTPQEVEKAAGVPVYPVENGIALLDTIETICNGR